MLRAMPMPNSYRAVAEAKTATKAEGEAQACRWICFAGVGKVRAPLQLSVLDSN